jgi:hypothetical protein
MAKQVDKAQSAQSNNSTPNLYIFVRTTDLQGTCIGERIVDMYHFGTRNWLQNHQWWAMHNSHCVETTVATPDQVAEYLARAKEALVEKFAKEVAA